MFGKQDNKAPGPHTEVFFVFLLIGLEHERGEWQQTEGAMQGLALDSERQDDMNEKLDAETSSTNKTSLCR